MEGVANFFREVARGGATRQAGMLDQQGQFLQQDYARGRADKALTDARIARDEEMQRAALEETLSKAGIGQAGAFSGLFRAGGGNADQVAQALGQFEQNAGLQMARVAAERGDLQGMNPGLALGDGKPLQTTRVSDGVAFNPYGAPQQDIATTPVGEATIGSRNATAGAAMALEALRGAQTKTADARTAFTEAQTRKAAANATIAEGDAEAMAAPIQKPAAPAAREGQLPGVEASPAAATIRPDIQQAVKSLGAARAATVLDLPNVETQADYDALPSGAYFFDFVEGTVNRKP
jgi:hypothetical protein